MILGLILTTTAGIGVYGLWREHQKKIAEQAEYDRLLEQKHLREHYESSTPFIPMKGVTTPDNDGGFIHTHTNVSPDVDCRDTSYPYKSRNRDRVRETHSTTVVNNYHDEGGSDDGTGAFAGAMLGSMVGNAMTQPVMPVAPVVAPSPVIVEPAPAPDVIQVPPETDGSSDVTYDGDSSSNGWNDSSNDETPQTDTNDGGSDVTYDGDSSSTDWGSSSNDSYSSNSDSGWSSDTSSSYDSSSSSSYDSGSSFDSGGSFDSGSCDSSSW